MSCKYHLDAARSSFSADGSMALVLAQCRTHTSGALGSMGWAPLVPSGDPTDIPSLLKLNILEEFSSSTKGLIFYLRWMLSDCCWHSSVKWACSWGLGAVVTASSRQGNPESLLRGSCSRTSGHRWVYYPVNGKTATVLVHRRRLHHLVLRRSIMQAGVQELFSASAVVGS